MAFPAIPKDIEVLDGTDVAAEWDRFEVFEALHHTLTFCNPLTDAQFDEVIDATRLEDGSDVLDAACGYGEFLLRACERASILGTGIDLSPWMVTTAHAEAKRRAPDAGLRWVLGTAKDFRPERPSDVAVCLGAEWVWHDFNGTARALGERVRVGGRVVIGAARLHHQADVAALGDRGAIETVDDMRRSLVDHGFKPEHRVDPDDAAWDAYLARTADAAELWAQRHPGERAEQWLRDQAEWHEARERDREVIGWSVWVARKSRGTE